MSDTPALFDLTGHVAVVTGGSKGIGLGMATALARAGADVAIWARDRDRADASAADLRALGARTHVVGCDVADETAIRAACSETVDALGRIDSCFANAGFGDGYDSLEVERDRWRKVLDVNVDGTFFTMREAARHMVERGGGGKLIAISSITERFGAANMPGYAASKGAIGAIVRSLAIEFARHDIQVNNLQPGWIETEATTGMRSNEKLRSTVVHRTPARRWGRVEDFGGIAVYLASRASNFHTGDTIVVDGGYSIF